MILTANLRSKQLNNVNASLPQADEEVLRRKEEARRLEELNNNWSERWHKSVGQFLFINRLADHSAEPRAPQSSLNPDDDAKQNKQDAIDLVDVNRDAEVESDKQIDVSDAADENDAEVESDQKIEEANAAEENAVCRYYSSFSSTPVDGGDASDGDDASDDDELDDSEEIDFGDDPDVSDDSDSDSYNPDGQS